MCAQVLIGSNLIVFCLKCGENACTRKFLKLIGDIVLKSFIQIPQLSRLILHLPHGLDNQGFTYNL